MNSTVHVVGKEPAPVSDLAEVAALAGKAAGDALPLTVIERRDGWGFLDFRELWRYRELLFFLTWRDIKVRYKQTALGAAWALLQPLALVLMFTLFLRPDPNSAEGQNVAYPLYAFLGLLAWLFFGNSVSTASQSIVTNQNLVTKIYFPRLIIPISAVCAVLVDFTIGALLLVPMMAYYRVPVTAGLGLVPLVVGLLVVAAVGVGTLLSALTVAYRDFRHVIPFTVQLWLFATPSIYRQATWGGVGGWLLPLNPAHGLIANFRLAVLGQGLDYYALTVSGLVGVALLFAGCLYFRNVERSFADII